MHELEIPLVFRAPSGVALPTKVYADIAGEAVEKGFAYAYALNAQIGRQVQHLGATFVAATQVVP